VGLHFSRILSSHYPDPTTDPPDDALTRILPPTICPPPDFCLVAWASDLFDSRKRAIRIAKQNLCPLQEPEPRYPGIRGVGSKWVVLGEFFQAV
jgi:hypothetical protein